MDRINYNFDLVILIKHIIFTEPFIACLLYTSLPFEIKMAESQYSNTEGIETEIQLADSGYGQGQILVNPDVYKRQDEYVYGVFRKRRKYGR